jgi:RNA polymerase sigma-70 factor (ECF subfamily)
MQADRTRRRRALRRLDPAVVRILSEVHGEFLRYLRRKLRSHADADDVMQEFHLRIVRYASTLRQEESIRIWLRRVLRSVFVSHLRRQRARQQAEADFARKDAATPPPDEELDRVVCRCMEKLLPTLRPEYADILRRVDLLEQTREAVAEALGMTVNNLTVRLHRARRALRRALELTCETCPIHGYLDCGCPYTKRLKSHAKTT